MCPPRWPAPGSTDLLEAARRQLGPAVAEVLLAEGAAMTAHEAVGFATGSDAGEPMGGAVPACHPAAAARDAQLGRGVHPDRAGT